MIYKEGSWPLCASQLSSASVLVFLITCAQQLFYSQPQEVMLHRSDGPLGFSIVGGVDHNSHPFGINEPGLFVSKVLVFLP